MAKGEIVPAARHSEWVGTVQTCSNKYCDVDTWKVEAHHDLNVLYDGMRRSIGVVPRCPECHRDADARKLTRP